jgi:hypothetical protein
VTDPTGRISALGIADVEGADAGFLFTPDGTHSFRGRGLRVPRLEALLTRWPHARVSIDPKDDRTVEPLVALLDRLGAWERVCIGASSDARLKRVRRLSRGRARTSMGPTASRSRSCPAPRPDAAAGARTAFRSHPRKARSRS